MQKFKVGDRVKFVGAAGHAPVGKIGTVRRAAGHAPVGKIGTVRRFDDVDYCVKFDDWGSGHSGGSYDLDDYSHWYCAPGELELAEPAWKTAKVGDWVSVRDDWLYFDIDKDCGYTNVAGYYQVNRIDDDDDNPARLSLDAGHEFSWCRNDRVDSIVPPPTKEVVPQPDKLHIVVSSRGAASKPHIHTSQSAAFGEAKRLSKKHPGDEFSVYQQVAVAHTPHAVTSLELT